MKILIADDDDGALRILKRYLEKWGHEVVEARDGDEAWHKLETEPCPILVTDWTMPRLDGIDLIRRVRASPLGDSVYTILITGRASKEDLVRGMEAGADDFVCKPYDRDELRVRLREGERIVALERALAEANGSRMERLRGRVTAAVEAADRELERAYVLLNAQGNDDARTAAEYVQRARDALAEVVTDS